MKNGKKLLIFIFSMSKDKLRSTGGRAFHNLQTLLKWKCLERLVL